MTREWKLVGDELFAIARDPRETTDVAARHPEVIARLRGELARFHAMEVPPSETGRFTAPPEWRMPRHDAARASPSPSDAQP